jgi:hypothetical protein
MSRRRNIDHRSKQLRQRKYKLQGTTTRLIPDADREFAHMAKIFAAHVEQHAGRFNIAADQVQLLAAAVTAFRDALSKTLNNDTAGPKTTRVKNQARAHAEDAVRAVARTLRALPRGTVTSVDRLMLNLPQRTQRPKRLECPNEAPLLEFRGSTSPQTLGGRHILEYRNQFDIVGARTGRPKGAARLELFVELVPQELAQAGKVPHHPGQLSGGKTWYLRSFTTRRFEVEPPVMADGSAALVVYWARWADATGGTGPFSPPCVARVEGGVGVPRALPGKQSAQVRVEQVVHYLEAKQVMFASHMLPPTLHEISGEAEPVRLLDAA